MPSVKSSLLSSLANMHLSKLEESDMKVLVTGNQGYIGSVMVPVSQMRGMKCPAMTLAFTNIVFLKRAAR